VADLVMALFGGISASLHRRRPHGGFRGVCRLHPTSGWKNRLCLDAVGDGPGSGAAVATLDALGLLAEGGLGCQAFCATVAEHQDKVCPVV